MFNRYPYTNFHELNLDYFIQHFKEIFTEWEQLYNELQSWKTDTTAELAQWRADVEEDLNKREAALRAELEIWKRDTADDISEWETATLNALDAWKTAATAQFEAIRVQAAASADAAAASQTAAETARTQAQAAQTAAEAAAQSVQASAVQIQQNENNINSLTKSVNVLYEDVTFTFHQGTLNSQYGTATNNATRIYSDYTNNFKNLVIETSAEYDYSIFWYIAPVENATSNFIYPSSGWISGTKHIGVDVEIPENAMLMRFAVRKHDNSNITPEEFQGTITRYIHDSSISEYMNYSPNVIYLCRDGRVTENVPPNSKYAVKMTAENQYDKIRFSAQKTTDDYIVAVHDTYIDQLAVNRDGTTIPANTIKTNECTLSQLNSYDWGLKYGNKYKGLRVPLLADCLKYASFYGLSVAVDIKWAPTESEIETLCDMFAKYGQQNAILFAVSIPNMQKFLTYCPNLSYAFGGTLNELTSQAGSLKLLRNGYNTIYADYRPIGESATDEYIAIARRNGIEIKITEIDSIEKIFNKAFGHGATLIECNNITMIKRTVRNYARDIIIPNL